jgi:hypothetical protein
VGIDELSDLKREAEERREVGWECGVGACER